jgi:protein O-mannosyl-transferase
VSGLVRDATVARLGPLAVFGLVAVVFARSLGHGFLAWDDRMLIVDNPHFRGLGLRELRWMGTTTLLGHYAPVTWVSFAVDYCLWGLRPAGYHLTNVLLHAGNAALVGVLAARLIGRATAWPTARCQAAGIVAALLWGLHPLRVEAVVWVTGRRDVLSGFLLLLTLLAYLRAVEAEGRSRAAWLGAAVVAYALALGSKAVVMALPVGLVALELYPLGGLARRGTGGDASSRRGVWARLAPFAALAILGAAVSYVGQSRGSGVRVLGTEEWLGKLAATVGLHAAKTVVPTGLSPLYELPPVIALRDPRYWVPAVAATAVGVALIALRPRWPAGLVAATWYLAFLAPVTAMTHAGPQLTADRYGYLPTLGLFVLAGSAVAALGARRPWAPGVGGAVAVVLILLSVQTWRQTEVWRDTLSVWRHAARVTPDCSICHLNLGHELLQRGARELALERFWYALALRPTAAAYRSVGVALEAQGQRAEAIQWYGYGLARVPASLQLGLSLATALVADDRLPEAVAAIEAPARFYEPVALVRYFEQAAAHRPAAPVPRLGLVRAWLRAGDRDRARAAYDDLHRLHPGLAALVAPAVAGHGATS